MTKFFKGKKQPVQQPEPRSMDELNKIYNELIGKLGVEELKVSIHTRNAGFYKEQLVQINNEADARQKLDQEAKAKEEQK